MVAGAIGAGIHDEQVKILSPVEGAVYVVGVILVLVNRIIVKQSISARRNEVGEPLPVLVVQVPEVPLRAKVVDYLMVIPLRVHGYVLVELLDMRVVAVVAPVVQVDVVDEVSIRPVNRGVGDAGKA